MNFIIRKANQDDAQAILDINIKSWQDTYKNIFPSEYLNNLCNDSIDYENAIKKNKQKIQENNNFYVAELENKIVGFCSFGNSKKNIKPLAGEIYALYVDKKYHNKGIGKELFNKTKKELSQKYNEIIVSCLVENKSNEFYQKMNCTKIGTCEFMLDGNSYEENLYTINLDK